MSEDVRPPPRGWSRRRFLAASLGLLAAGGAGLAYVRWWEPGWLEVTRRTVPVGRLDGPVRVLHLADLHAGPSVSTAHIARAVALGLAEKPDLALLTGDFITAEFADWEPFAEALRPLAAAVPTFASPGNHDGGAWTARHWGHSTLEPLRAGLAAAGVPLLINQRREIAVRGQTLELAGLADHWAGRAEPEAVLRPRAPDRRRPPVLVLAHNPDAKALLRPFEWDLTLCGHTHGGQCVVPLLGWRPFLPVQDKSMVAGLYPWDGRHVHVTRGVGSLYGLRLNCRPEVSVLELV